MIVRNDSSPNKGNGASSQPPIQEVVLIRTKTLWLAAAIAMTLFISWIVLTRALTVVFLLFGAVIFAEAIRPAVDWLSKRMPRWLAVILIYAGLAVILAGLMYLLLQPLIAEVSQLSQDLPGYLNRLQSWLSNIESQANGSFGALGGLGITIGGSSGQLGSLLRQLAPYLLSAPITIGSLLFDMVIVFLLAFFWLTGIQGLKPFVIGLLPPHSQADALDVLNEMALRVGGYLRGVAFNTVVVGVLSGLGVWVLKVPFPVALGVVAGLAEAIPLLGPYIGGAAAVIVALASGGLVQAGEVVLLYLVIQQFENNILVPVVQEHVVKLSPLGVVLSLTLGAVLFGIVGALLAVPAAAALKVLIIRVLAPAARRASGAEPDSEALTTGEQQESAPIDSQAFPPAPPR